MKNEKMKPEYIRLLGMNKKGRNYLNENKKNISLPIISKPSAFKDDAFYLDIKASKVYAQILNEPARQNLMKMEFSQPPIQIERIGD